MKKILYTLGILTGMVIIAAFTKSSKEETFKVDTQRSSITWIGRKVTGQHAGNIKLSSGQLIFSGKSIKTGAFVIDMTSITCSDLEGAFGQKLITHLKSDDFFAVDKNPESKFELTKVTAAGSDRVTVTGNLTIKGITNVITFPATIKRKGDAAVIVAKGVKVDRTKYDIKYGSKTFFESIGDKAIDNEFELALNLVAKK